MRKPNPSRGSGFSDTAHVNAKIRHRTSISDLPTPGELSARLYAPHPIVRDRRGELIESERPREGRRSSGKWIVTFISATRYALDLPDDDLDATIRAYEAVREGRRGNGR